MIDFALLGHPANADHLADLLAELRPGLDADKAHEHQKTLAKVFEWSAPFAANDELIIPAAGGAALCGRLIVCTFLPEHAHSPRQLAAAYQKTREGVSLAKALGAKIVGLGGFTSIVGGTQGEKLPNEFGLAVTSGNSLTVALTMAQLNALLSRLRWPLAGRTVAILGASGDIGRACLLALLREQTPKHLILIARNRAKLESLRNQLLTSLGNERQIEIQATTDVKEALRAQLIIAATSAAVPLLTEAELQPGTIICDIGYPNTLAYSPEPRPDVLAFHGGLAQAPFPLPITHYTRLPAADLLHGCFCETILLALAGRYESYSLGQGQITLERMQTILELAQRYGFQPAPLYREQQLITDDALNAFVQHAATV